MATLAGELVVLSGPYKGRRVPISKEVMRLGRERTCEVALEDEAASRVHAEVRNNGGSLSLKDLDSTNGTYLNDERIAKEIQLKNGDRVAIGDTVFLVEMAAASRASPQVVFSEERKGVTTRVTLQLDDQRFLELKETTVTDALRYVTVLYEFMSAVTGVLHRGAMLERMLDFMLKVFRADRGVVLLLAPDGSPGAKHIRVRDGLEARDDISISRTAARQVLEQKQSFLSVNTETDERLAEADSIHKSRVRSIMGVPLKLKDRILGLVYLDKLEAKDAFSETDLKLCTAMCLQAAVCLENANLYSELLDAAEFNNAILRSLTSGLLVVDLYGRVIRVNRAALEILGCPEGALLNKKLGDQEAFADLGRVVDETLEKGTPEDRYEIRLRRENGIVPLGLSTSPLTDHGGQLVGVVANFRNLAHLRKLEEQLRRSQHLAALGQMAAGVAHEIRNPLNSIRGFTQLIQEANAKDESREKFAEYTQIVLEEVDRMNKIVQDLLDFSRQRDLTLIPVALDKLVADLLKDMEPDFKAARIKLDFAPPEQPPPGVLGNDDKLRQVLRNMLLNAIQASEAGASIEVRVEAAEGVVLQRNEEDEAMTRPRREVVVVIQDHGVGMTPEIQGRIFDPFFTQKDIGTGLGLSISQKIVDQHGGRIEVESAPGQGSTFSVHLPAV
ncbi:MAG: ATP-binding protein [Planctomycetota bacterium]|nr:ATP-binding protein [Planctomycetota bacterium]